jgi:hypothetical protein
MKEFVLEEAEVAEPVVGEKKKKKRKASCGRRPRVGLGNYEHASYDS